MATVQFHLEISIMPNGRCVIS